MRVGILTGIYHPELGGPATFLYRLRADLGDLGWDSVVITYGEQPKDRDVHRISRRYPVPVRWALYAFAVLRYARRSDVWFVNDYGLVAAILASLLRKPIVIKVVGDFAWESAVRRRLVADPTAESSAAADPLMEFQRSRHGVKVRVLKMVRTFGAVSARRVIVPSKYLARVVESWGVSPKSIVVVHNGVDEAEFPARSPAEQPTVVAAARLVAWKGIDHLLHAFRAVVEAVPRARLRILGDGPERQNLEAQALVLGFPAGSVVFEGAVRGAEVRTALAAAHVFVLASAYEGLPHVILEAFAAGCPVVATGCGGTVEVVEDHRTGILVAYGDREALRAAIVRVLTTPETARAMSEEGRRRVRAQFAWTQTRERTLSILEEASIARRR
jgi:glycosyltransferase involved in cell wall biosynthesis